LFLKYCIIIVSKQKKDRKMSYFNKDQYQSKQEWADKRMSLNKEVDSLFDDLIKKYEL